MGAIQRLRQFIETKGVSKYGFYQKVGLSNGFLDKGENIGSDKCEKIIYAYPELNPDWLLTGNGSMLREEQEQPNVPVLNYEHKGAPYYDVDFIGGFDAVYNDQTLNPAYYIDFVPYNKEGILWCNLTGHSMEPELNNGDIIAIKEVKTPIEYLPVGEIYAFVTDDYRTVKRLAKSSREGYVKLIPANKSPEYSEQEIPVSMIRKIFAVLVGIHKF